MLRVIIGSAVAAFAMFVIGFVFFGPLGLSNLATHSGTDAQAAAVQQVLRANLPETGTYEIPNETRSPDQTRMYGNGPVATIHYNVEGQTGMNAGTAVKGLVFNFAIALLFGLALLGIDGRVRDFPSRARVAAIIGVAGAAFVHLGEPIYYHHDWPHFIYAFLADGLMLAAAGVIVAWFLKVPEEAVVVVKTEEVEGHTHSARLE